MQRAAKEERCTTVSPPRSSLQDMSSTVPLQQAAGSITARLVCLEEILTNMGRGELMGVLGRDRGFSGREFQSMGN